MSHYTRSILGTILIVVIAICSSFLIGRWTESIGAEPGYIMDLATLWRLASRWYEGRVETGYERREPTQALE